ncbi:MAG: hypothetical protein AAGU75_24480 [Bacillota bacterium]
MKKMGDKLYYYSESQGQYYIKDYLAYSTKSNQLIEIDDYSDT